MSIILQTKSGEFRIDAEDDSETLLFAGLKAGLTLPYECATGSCGTCRARVMRGDVNDAWPEAPGTRQLKRQKGDVLMCQTRARGECLIRVPAVVDKKSENAPRRITGKIDQLNRLNRDVMDFVVDLEDETAFAAGQFMVVNVPGLAGGRAYSMVNYEPQTDRLRFVVKRKPGGGFSEWLYGEDATGTEISLFGPLGKATFQPATDGDLIFITGGSGIAGIMSILEHAVRSGHFSANRGQLFFGVRTLQDAFYVQELAALAERSNGALSVTLALSHEAAPSNTHPTSDLIQLSEGFVHDVAARSLATTAQSVSDEAIGFVAGPPAMVDGAIRVLLGDGNLPPDRIRYDKFS